MAPVEHDSWGNPEPVEEEPPVEEEDEEYEYVVNNNSGAKIMHYKNALDDPLPKTAKGHKWIEYKDTWAIGFDFCLVRVVPKNHG